MLDDVSASGSSVICYLLDCSSYCTNTEGDEKVPRKKRKIKRKCIVYPLFCKNTVQIQYPYLSRYFSRTNQFAAVSVVTVPEPLSLSPL